MRRTLNGNIPHAHPAPNSRAADLLTLGFLVRPLPAAQAQMQTTPSPDASACGEHVTGALCSVPEVSRGADGSSFSPWGDLDAEELTGQVRWLKICGKWRMRGGGLEAREVLSKLKRERLSVTKFRDSCLEPQRGHPRSRGPQTPRGLFPRSRPLCLPAKGHEVAPRVRPQPGGAEAPGGKSSVCYKWPHLDPVPSTLRSRFTEGRRERFESSVPRARCGA